MSGSPRFCSECGSPVADVTTSAEYKQVTVLFADVVHSMDIAAAVGAERLREIITELVERSAGVITRFDGTVDKFTGDGIMAVFGAPVALEDHAIRACLASLGVQEEARRLAVEVQEWDGVDLQLRIGLNSGQVIAGEISSGAFGYTAIGEQVGMAQRMEAGAPPGEVMLSASTARLVQGIAVLSEPELVTIKGAQDPVPGRRLLGMQDQHHAIRREESVLVGRRWEMSAMEGLLDYAFDGHGAVLALAGPPGIGKSRLVREVATIAGRHGVQVVQAFCESHTSQVPFHAVAALLRAATGVEGLEAPAARERIRAGLADADAEDLLLFEDLLGIGEPDAALAKIAPDARRRRLTALVNASSLARDTSAVYVIEDAHWIDEVSESMLADFLTVIPQTPLLALITYRPEYTGALSRVPNSQTISLSPLRDRETSELVDGLLGPDQSVDGLRRTICERAAGNPFFAEEIVRELAERGVLLGHQGAYRSTVDVAEVTVPATLQTTIAARIDRLDPKAKRTLSAAAVVGSRFGLDLLIGLGVEPVVSDLLGAQLVDQVKFGRQPEFFFRNPVIRAVAYEARLKSERSDLHRRLAAAIEERGSPDESAALIAEHLEAAGDLRAAYDWHMRAGNYSGNRDIHAARISWERARRVADALPATGGDQAVLRIAPRTALCVTTWRAGKDVAETGFGELRELCEGVGDEISLASGMYGQIVGLAFQHRHREASSLATEQVTLLENSGDAIRAIGYVHGSVLVKLLAGEPVEAYRVAQWAMDLLGDDPLRGRMLPSSGSPLAMTMLYRGIAGCALARPGWRSDVRRAITLERSVNPHGVVLLFMIGVAYSFGSLVEAVSSDDRAVEETADLVRLAEEGGDDVVLGTAYLAHGLVLSHRGTAAERQHGLDFLQQVRDLHVPRRILATATMANIRTAEMTAEAGDLEHALESARAIVNELVGGDEKFLRYLAAAVLVRSLLMRGSSADVQEATAEIDRLAAVPIDREFAVKAIVVLRLRALLARAHGDEAAFRDYADRYRAMAKSAQFEPHIALAEAML